jgi:hypothetical protein
LLDLYTYIYGTGATTVTPGFTPVVAASENCPTAATLEFWDATTQQYLFDNNPPAAAGTPPPHAWITSFSLTNGVFVINEATHTRFGIRHDYYVRLTVTLTESISTSKSAVYLFQVIIKHKCADNKIALNNSLAFARTGTTVVDFPYTIGDSQVDKTPLISTVKDNLDCPIVSQLFIWVDSDNAWKD